MKTTPISTLIRLYGGPLDGHEECVQAEFDPMIGGHCRKKVYEFRAAEPKFPPRTETTVRYRELSPFEADYVYVRDK